jgi:hypothetical protein
MKNTLITFLLLSSLRCIAQTADEQQLLTLSSQVFKWEVAGKMDSLANTLHEKFTVMGSNGARQTRTQYIARLSGGNFVHNAIDVKENVATIAGNTGIVMGKGQFTVTSNGKQTILSLGYTEVFTRSDETQPWKLLAIHANPLPEATH